MKDDIRRTDRGGFIFNRIFDKLLEDIAIDFGVEPEVSVESSPGRPWVHISVDEHSAQVKLELAGYRKENLSIEVEGQIITVSGERNDTGFTKTFRVDTNTFDIDSLNATHENGLLTVTLNKLDNAEKKTVNIQ